MATARVLDPDATGDVVVVSEPQGLLVLLARRVLVESKFGREGLEKRLLHVDFAHHLVGVVADVQELDDFGGLALARELVRGILQVPEVLRGGFLRGEWILEISR